MKIPHSVILFLAMVSIWKFGYHSLFLGVGVTILVMSFFLPQMSIKNTSIQARCVIYIFATIPVLFIAYSYCLGEIFILLLGVSLGIPIFSYCKFIFTNVTKGI
ncbi:hypothetical protein ACFLY7_00730 [Patescibacteria group bacterium]